MKRDGNVKEIVSRTLAAVKDRLTKEISYLGIIALRI
jgi:hypothetical protein